MWYLLFLLPIHVLCSLRCHSCLTYCKTTVGTKIDAVGCDCMSKAEDMCVGNACFAKIEIFSDEKTAIIQKGCITDIPGGQKGCQYASNFESVHCFCEENECNIRKKVGYFIEECAHVFKPQVKWEQFCYIHLIIIWIILGHNFNESSIKLKEAKTEWVYQSLIVSPHETNWFVVVQLCLRGRVHYEVIDKFNIRLLRT
uniref:Protein quiver n=1 Tax=Angiostrongylus cantonensis TaxID=6313 RepID=A0A0K0DN95_ANGCA